VTVYLSLSVCSTDCTLIFNVFWTSYHMSRSFFNPILQHVWARRDLSLYIISWNAH